MGDPHPAPPEGLRTDKWLWAARFFKTRSLATAAIHAGHIRLNGSSLKPARDLRVGDTLEITLGNVRWTIVVRGINEQRRPASEAQQLYEETPESVQRREAAAQQRRLAAEPAHTIEQGRPTKRDRRQMDEAWNERWSAGLD